MEGSVVAFTPCCMCDKKMCDICELSMYWKGIMKNDLWISVDERLPEENEAVLIWTGSVNVARICKGITEEERKKMENGEISNPVEIGWSLSTGFIPIKRSSSYKGCDVFGNNLVPYCWKATSGPMEWFGQNVSHWMPLPIAPNKGDFCGYGERKDDNHEASDGN